jgi:hypothetical protein
MSKITTYTNQEDANVDNKHAQNHLCSPKTHPRQKGKLGKSESDVICSATDNPSAISSIQYFIRKHHLPQFGATI